MNRLRPVVWGIPKGWLGYLYNIPMGRKETVGKLLYIYNSNFVPIHK